MACLFSRRNDRMMPEREGVVGFEIGKSAYAAAQIAANYTVACIKATAEENNHWFWLIKNL